LIKKLGSGRRSCSLWPAIIGIGIGVAVAIAVGYCRPIQPIAIATPIPIPIPTDIVFSSLFDAAECQPTYELIGKWWKHVRRNSKDSALSVC
jgi:hypothetical protein